MLWQHTRSFSRVVSKRAAIWELVATSTLRAFRDKMVRSQPIIVTNSTQMQEHLLTEPDTCPCKQLLFSACRQSRTAVLAFWNRDSPCPS